MTKILAALALLALVLGVGLATHVIGLYDGLNKGITVGNCGFELVGEMGPFCGNY